MCSSELNEVWSTELHGLCNLDRGITVKAQNSPSMNTNDFQNSADLRIRTYYSKDGPINRHQLSDPLPILKKWPILLNFVSKK